MTKKDNTWSPFDESSIELDSEVLGECRAQRDIEESKEWKELSFEAKFQKRYRPLLVFFFTFFGLKSVVATLALFLYFHIGCIPWISFVVLSFILFYFLGTVLRGEKIGMWHVIAGGAIMHFLDIAWGFFPAEPFSPIPAAYDEVGHQSRIFLMFQVAVFWIGFSLMDCKKFLKEWKKQIKIVLAILGAVAVVLVLIPPERHLLGLHAGVEEFNLSLGHQRMIYAYQERPVSVNGVHFLPPPPRSVRSYRDALVRFDSHFRWSLGWGWIDGVELPNDTKRELLVDREQQIWLYRVIGEDGSPIFSMLVQIQDGQVLAIW